MLMLLLILVLPKQVEIVNQANLLLIQQQNNASPILQNHANILMVLLRAMLFHVHMVMMIPHANLSIQITNGIHQMVGVK